MDNIDNDTITLSQQHTSKEAQDATIPNADNDDDNSRILGNSSDTSASVPNDENPPLNNSDRQQDPGDFSENKRDKEEEKEIPTVGQLQTFELN